MIAYGKGAIFLHVMTFYGYPNAGVESFAREKNEHLIKLTLEVVAGLGNVPVIIGSDWLRLAILAQPWHAILCSVHDSYIRIVFSPVPLFTVLVNRLRRMQTRTGHIMILSICCATCSIASFVTVQAHFGNYCVRL